MNEENRRFVANAATGSLTVALGKAVTAREDNWIDWSVVYCGLEVDWKTGHNTNKETYMEVCLGSFAFRKQTL